MTFSIRDSFKRAWKLLKENLLVLVGLSGVVVLISWIIRMWGIRLSNFLEHGRVGIASLFLVLYIFTILISLLARIGYTKIILKLYDNREIDPWDIFAYYDRLLKYIAVSILYSLIVIGGAILLIVPGLILATKYVYAFYFVIDQKMNPVEALKASAKITYGHKWKLFLFGLCVAGINIIGLVLLGIGFLFTFPLTTFATVHIFRTLNGTSITQQELPLPKESEGHEKPLF